MAIPANPCDAERMTLLAWSRRMLIDATTAPTAVPSATTPTSADACVVP